MFVCVCVCGCASPAVVVGGNGAGGGGGGVGSVERDLIRVRNWGRTPPYHPLGRRQRGTDLPDIRNDDSAAAIYLMKDRLGLG